MRKATDFFIGGLCSFPAVNPLHGILRGRVFMGATARFLGSVMFDFLPNILRFLAHLASLLHGSLPQILHARTVGHGACRSVRSHASYKT